MNLKILLIPFILFAHLGLSQNTNSIPSPVLAGPDGNYVFLYDNVNRSNTNIRAIAHTVSRAPKGSNNFAKIATLQKPANIAELKAKVNPNILAELKASNNLATDEALFSFVQKSDYKQFGLATLNFKFLQAVGLLYIDKEAGNNLNYTYKVEPVQGDGIRYIHEVYDPKVLIRTTPKFKTSYVFANDSIANIKWSIPRPNDNFIYFGNVYRQTGLKPQAQQINERIIAVFTEKQDSLHFYSSDTVQPENLYKYHIQITDFVGNTINYSDTATAMAVSFKRIKPIQNLTVKDTLDGLHLKWDKLPNRLYYTGIQVGRSRDIRERFIVIDTLSANTTEYFDSRLLPNITYYYQLRPILLPVNGWGLLPTATGNASFESKNRKPLPVYGLKASHEGQNIRLNWKATSDVDLHGYFVMRANSEKDNFEVVSPVLQDTTYVDTTSTLNGRVQYLYAIKAVNMYSKESDLLNKVTIRPLKYETVHTPAGIEGYADNGRIYLAWDDARKYESAVSGYLLYKRPASGKTLTDLNLPALYTAEKQGFKLAYPNLITVTSFVDDDIERGKEYEYSVVAVDPFQMQSSLSPAFKIMVPKIQLLPPAQVYVRNTTKGIEIAWPNTNIDLQNVIVYRRGLADKTLTKIGTSKGKELFFIDATAKAKTTYVYAISYQTRDGESPKSIEKSMVKN